MFSAKGFAGRGSQLDGYYWGYKKNRQIQPQPNRNDEPKFLLLHIISETPELANCIVPYLSPQDLRSVEQTCHYFRAACADFDNSPWITYLNPDFVTTLRDHELSGYPADFCDQPRGAKELFAECPIARKEEYASSEIIKGYIVKRYPNIHLKLLTSLTTTQLPELRNGRIDLALTMGMARTGNVNFISLDTIVSLIEAQQPEV